MLTKQVLETGLAVEMEEHLGDENTQSTAATATIDRVLDEVVDWQNRRL